MNLIKNLLFSQYSIWRQVFQMFWYFWGVYSQSLIFHSLFVLSSEMEIIYAFCLCVFCDKTLQEPKTWFLFFLKFLIWPFKTSSGTSSCLNYFALDIHLLGLKGLGFASSKGLTKAINSSSNLNWGWASSHIKWWCCCLVLNFAKYSFLYFWVFIIFLSSFFFLLWAFFSFKKSIYRNIL